MPEAVGVKLPCPLPMKSARPPAWTFGDYVYITIAVEISRAHRQRAGSNIERGASSESAAPVADQNNDSLSVGVKRRQVRFAVAVEVANSYRPGPPAVTSPPPTAIAGPNSPRPSPNIRNRRLQNWWPRPRGRLLRHR